MDTLTRLPIPPIGTEVTALNLTIAAWIAGISGVVVLTGVIFGLKDWKEMRSPVLICLLIGGAMDSLVEPLVDIIGGCWHPVIGQHTLFEVMGRPMPNWVPVVYAGFYGSLAALVYALCRRGLSARGMWILFAICIVAEPISEGGMLHWHSYYYYANQPLWIAGLPPLWWIPANICAIYLTGVTAVFAVQKIGGWTAALMMVFASPLIDAAATTLAGFPSIVAVNSPFPFWLTQLCGLMTFAIAIYATHIVIRLAARDSPARLIDFAPSV
jgi:hypothetical protein